MKGSAFFFFAGVVTGGAVVGGLSVAKMIKTFMKE